VTMPRRAQSSAASSVAEPLPSAPASPSADEEPPPAAPAHHPHTANGHADAWTEASVAAAAAAAVSPVGAEALVEEGTPFPPAPTVQKQEKEREMEATHGVYPGENVLPFTSELRVLRPENVSVCVACVVRAFARPSELQ
jgi:hypothetical protein